MSSSVDLPPKDTVPKDPAPKEETQRQRLWRFLQSVLPHDYYDVRVKRFSTIALEGMLLNSRILGVVTDIDLLIPKNASDMLRADKVRRHVLMNCPMLEMLRSIEDEMQRDRNERKKEEALGAHQGAPSLIVFSDTPKNDPLQRSEMSSSSFMLDNDGDRDFSLDGDVDVLECLQRMAPGRRCSVDSSDAVPNGRDGAGGNQGRQLGVPVNHTSSTIRGDLTSLDVARSAMNSRAHAVRPMRWRSQDVSLRDHTPALLRRESPAALKAIKSLRTPQANVTAPHASKDLLDRCRMGSHALPDLRLGPLRQERHGASVLRLTSGSMPEQYRQQTAEQRVSRVLPFVCKSIRLQSHPL